MKTCSIENTISDVESEFESVVITLKSLLHLASQEICSSSPHSLALITAAERYAADLTPINKRLLALQAAQRNGGAA